MPWSKAKHLVLGAGEVGAAIDKVLSPFYDTSLADINPTACEGVDVLHIAFGWSPEFVRYVHQYQGQFKPRYTVIHSTVPVGTSDLCGAVHSPIRGKHYEMFESIRRIPKFFGGKDAHTVADYFLRIGVPVVVCGNARTTELAKLLATTYLGVLIEFAKDADRLCVENAVPFAEAYTLFFKTFNEATERWGLGDPQYPVITPIRQTIGGHCVLQNCELFEESMFAQLIKKMESMAV
jgi:hypothetical protein